MTSETLSSLLSYITYGGAIATLCVATITLYRHQKAKRENQ